jgi:hypothetical protein
MSRSIGAGAISKQPMISRDVNQFGVVRCEDADDVLQQSPMGRCSSLRPLKMRAFLGGAGQTRRASPAPQRWSLAGASCFPSCVKQAKRKRTVSPGRTCKVMLVLLCLPDPPLSASMEIAVTPGGTTYS